MAEMSRTPVPSGADRTDYLQQVADRAMGPQTQTYEIKPGDTLSEIAARHGVTVAEMMDLNPQVRDPSRIAAGAMLNLPGSAPSMETVERGSALDEALADLGGDDTGGMPMSEGPPAAPPSMPSFGAMDVASPRPDEGRSPWQDQIDAAQSFREVRDIEDEWLSKIADRPENRPESAYPGQLRYMQQGLFSAGSKRRAELAEMEGQDKRAGRLEARSERQGARAEDLADKV